MARQPQQGFAGHGGSRRGHALDDDPTHVGLERLDALTDRGRRDAERFGRPLEGPFVDDRHEGSQVLVIHEAKQMQSKNSLLDCINALSLPLATCSPPTCSPAC